MADFESIEAAAKRASVGTKEKPAAIALELDDMRGHIARIEDLVNQVRERFAPVLKPSYPEPTDPSHPQPDRMQNSDIAEALSYNTRRLNGILSDLIDFNSRCDL